MKRICITGANGFIGKSLCKSLKSSNNHIRGFVRARDLANNFSEIEYISVGDISPKTNWKDHLNGVDCIIHCAGVVHQMNEGKDLNFYNLVNVDGSKRLAKQAAEAGVKRLIFLSSIKVNGESIEKINTEKKISYKDISNPQDFYSLSKLEAEKALWKVSAKTGLEVVVLRLPLVYGYGAKGNLARLIKLVQLGIPLPLSMINNQRSMIGIDNLVDLINCCINHPKASGKTFLVSDGEDISTPNFIKLIASSMGRKAILFPVPIFFLKFLSFIFSKKKEIDRLLGSLRIDNNTMETLNWKPPLSVKEGIRRMIQRK